MMKLIQITSYFQELIPNSMQESYDNCGWQVGNPDDEFKGVLFSLDCTLEVVEEAISKKCNLIICHHPLIFGGVKKITGNNYVEKTIIKAIKNDISIFTIHTNADNFKFGVNRKISEVLNLKNIKVLSPVLGKINKLVTFAPNQHAEQLRNALFDAGAGNIGEYSNCSFNIKGEGSFRGNENTNPFVGKQGETHFENETRIEVIYSSHQTQKILTALKENHPYEEVAYDIYKLENQNQDEGAGAIGNLENPIDELAFLKIIKQKFNVPFVKHTQLLNKNISKVAVCGGTGSFLLKDAIRAKADVFITADFKYHQFFDAENKIVIVDIGHYESEQFTSNLFYDLFMKNFSNFAAYISHTNTNPVNYF
jgi:dinuclear metal center YbgI/SA1388 family protein